MQRWRIAAIDSAGVTERRRDAVSAARVQYQSSPDGFISSTTAPVGEPAAWSQVGAPPPAEPAWRPTAAGASAPSWDYGGARAKYGSAPSMEEMAPRPSAPSLHDVPPPPPPRASAPSLHDVPLPPPRASAPSLHDVPPPPPRASVPAAGEIAAPANTLAANEIAAMPAPKRAPVEMKAPATPARPSAPAASEIAAAPTRAAEGSLDASAPRTDAGDERRDGAEPGVEKGSTRDAVTAAVHDVAAAGGSEVVVRAAQEGGDASASGTDTKGTDVEPGLVEQRVHLELSLDGELFQQTPGGDRPKDDGSHAPSA